MLPKLKKQWINNIKLDGDKQKQNSETCRLRQSNSAQFQSLASKLQETQLEHQQLYTAQERQLQFEAQTLKQSQHEEQQAAILAREYELAIQELRRQAEEQPELLKLQWRGQLSQQASYKAEMGGCLLLWRFRPVACFGFFPVFSPSVAVRAFFE